MGDPSRVVPRRLATQDLRDAATRYAAEADAATARRFIDLVEQAFTIIATQPGIGSPRYAVDLDWPGLRTHTVRRFPYLIFYIEQTDHLDVLRVLHGKPHGGVRAEGHRRGGTTHGNGSTGLGLPEMGISLSRPRR